MMMMLFHALALEYYTDLRPYIDVFSFAKKISLFADYRVLY